MGAPQMNSALLEWGRVDAGWHRVQVLVNSRLVKKKKPKPRLKWTTSKPPLRKRSPMAAPERGGHWRRSVLVLMLGLLMPLLWFLGDAFSDPAAAPLAAVHLSHDATPAEVTAGRSLGFLHAVGFQIVLLAAGFTTIFLHARMLPDEAGMGPFLAHLFGIGLLVCVPSAFLWRYGWVPLVDMLWEAGGGRMVAYELGYPARGSRSGSTLSSHNWGENASLLMTPVLLAIIAVVAGMRDGTRSRRSDG